MDLIPEDNCDYSKKQYWEDRFAQEKEYDWLITYPGIAHLFTEIQKDASIIHLGCGNSILGAEMYAEGW